LLAQFVPLCIGLVDHLSKTSAPYVRVQTPSDQPPVAPRVARLAEDVAEFKKIIFDLQEGNRLLEERVQVLSCSEGTVAETSQAVDVSELERSLAQEHDRNRELETQIKRSLSDLAEERTARRLIEDSCKVLEQRCRTYGQEQPLARRQWDAETARGRAAADRIQQLETQLATQQSEHDTQHSQLAQTVDNLKSRAKQAETALRSAEVRASAYKTQSDSLVKELHAERVSRTATQQAQRPQPIQVQQLQNHGLSLLRESVQVATEHLAAPSTSRTVVETRRGRTSALQAFADFPVNKVDRDLISGPVVDLSTFHQLFREQREELAAWSARQETVMAQYITDTEHLAATSTSRAFSEAQRPPSILKSLPSQSLPPSAAVVGGTGPTARSV